MQADKETNFCSCHWSENTFWNHQEHRCVDHSIIWNMKCIAQCIWTCPQDLDFFYLNIFGLPFKTRFLGMKALEFKCISWIQVCAIIFFLFDFAAISYSDFSRKCILAWHGICKVSACSYKWEDKLQPKAGQCREGKGVHGNLFCKSANCTAVLNDTALKPEDH